MKYCLLLSCLNKYLWKSSVTVTWHTIFAFMVLLNIDNIHRFLCATLANECSAAASVCSVLPLPVLFLGRPHSHINVRRESRLPHLPLEPLAVIMTQIYWKTILKKHQGGKSSNLWSRVCSSLFDVFHKISFISLLAQLRFWRLLRACKGARLLLRTRRPQLRHPVVK